MHARRISSLNILLLASAASEARVGMMTLHFLDQSGNLSKGGKFG